MTRRRSRARLALADRLSWALRRPHGAVPLGTPPLHVLTVDMVLFGTVYATAGITFERWMGWIAVLSLAGAALSAYAPVVSPVAVLVVNLTTILSAVLYWRRER